MAGEVLKCNRMYWNFFVFLPPDSGVAGRYCFYSCLSVHSGEGGVCLPTMPWEGGPPPPPPRWDHRFADPPSPYKVNRRVVRMLLECILVRDAKERKSHSYSIEFLPNMVRKTLNSTFVYNAVYERFPSKLINE